MFKRKDNDIFGTASLTYTPRIENNSRTDPYAAFKRKTDQNYDKYSSKLQSLSHDITGKFVDQTKVNQEANFQDDYHKFRKQKDMQSSIFYPPTNCNRSLTQNSLMEMNRGVDKSQKEANFGRKETLSRQIHSLPYNKSSTKGNQSRLFDLDQRIQHSDKKQKMYPLIPYKMQWDQHDSIRYSHINAEKTEVIKQINTIDNTIESKSTYFELKEQKPEKPITKTILEKQENTTSQKQTKLKQIKSTKQKKMMPEKQILNSTGPVQIKIQKGWDSKLLEGLSKHCKLNGTQMLKFEIDEYSKGLIILKRSQRWQNVADWLRKDAKLKIRVINP